MQKTIMITGATSGIGSQLAKLLINKENNLIIHGRNEIRISNVIQEIKSMYPNCQIKGYLADLSVQSEITAMTKKIIEEFSHIDVLINNAACVSSKNIITIDGVELQLAVNHLAPFLLTHQLLPLLKKSKQGRIVNVNSRAHARGTINFKNLFLNKEYNISKAYNQSKLCNMMFSYYLAEKTKQFNITVNAFHPGLVNTSFGSKNVSIIHELVWDLMKTLGRKPEKACQDAVFLAIDETLATVSGKYFHNKRQIESSLESYDKNKQEKLWEVSLELTNIKNEEYGKL